MADDEETPEPFATVDDLEARWRVLTETERARAEILLADASDKIRVTCPRWAAASAATLRRITCEMVRRAMSVADDMIGVTNASQSAIGFSESKTFSNPMGDLRLWPSEIRELGGGVGRIFSTDICPPLPRREGVN